MIVYLDGEWLQERDAHIAVDDRGFLYADGIFETARLHEGRYFRFEEHMERLAAGAATMELAVPAPAELRRIADGLRERDPMRHGTFRITVTRGSESAGRPTVLASLRPIPGDWRERAAAGWSLQTASIRHPDALTMPSHLKALGRIHGLLARREAVRAGADDALLLTRDGCVAEGPTWNLFWRHGRVLRTASLDTGILDGVTRRVVLGLARDAGYDVEEGEWPRAALDEADELFATMSSLGLVPIVRLDDRGYAIADQEAVSCLRDLYWRIVASETAGG